MDSEFSVSVNINSGSNKDFIFEICSDYFDFNKKESKDKTNMPIYSETDKLNKKYNIKNNKIKEKGLSSPNSNIYKFSSSLSKNSFSKRKLN